MYNFLDGRLTPKVSTNCPCTDGYEASNLVSKDNNLMLKGFLAYTAIRTPIDVDFHLICPVTPYYIAVWCTVGSQKSSGFEIFYENNNEYKTLARVFLKDEIGFVACNKTYYTEEKKKPKIPSGFKIYFFKSNKYKTFTSLQKFKIRILRTENSVPCIGKIEIWGKESETCTEKTKETIHHLMTRKQNESPTFIHFNLNEPSTSEQCIPNLEIPEDFIDPISCEVMSIPVTLPCGKNIDKSTLEKHQESEAKWGRRPSDPFTGQLFTNNRKSVLNTALKSRIDEFLLKNKNNNETKTVQRTVGNLTDNTQMPDYVVKHETKRLRLSAPENCLQSTSSDDLDKAIEKTFENYNIIRYSKIEAEILKPVKITCAVCSNENNTYILLCKHFICRQCLLDTNIESICKVCNQNYSRNDVQKYYGK